MLLILRSRQVNRRSQIGDDIVEVAMVAEGAPATGRVDVLAHCGPQAGMHLEGILLGRIYTRTHQNLCLVKL